MKILIGISSITLLGILYSVIKNYFKTPKKIIEGQPINNNNNNKNNNNNNNNNVELIGINKELNNKIDELNNMFEKLVKMTYAHHKLYRTNMYNTLFNNNIKYMDIHITNKNSTLSNGILTIDNPELLGFSVNGLNVTSVIYKNSTFDGVTNAKYINIIDNDSVFQKFISEDLIFAQIPITTTSVNSHQSDSRHHPYTPEIVHGGKIVFTIADENHSAIPDGQINRDLYHIDIEIMHVDSLEIFGYLKDIYGLNMLNHEIPNIPDLQKMINSDLITSRKESST